MPYNKNIIWGFFLRLKIYKLIFINLFIIALTLIKMDVKLKADEKDYCKVILTTGLSISYHTQFFLYSCGDYLLIILITLRKHPQLFGVIDEFKMTGTPLQFHKFTYFLKS